MTDLERIIFDLKRPKKEIAEALGVHPSAITQVLNKKMVMPDRWKNILATKYKVDISAYEVKKLTVIEKTDTGKPIAIYEDLDVYGNANPVLTDHITMKPSAFVTIPMFSSGEAAVQVKGHSMKGYINHGDWIVIKRINNKDAIIYGEPYLVVTKSDNLKTVKFVKKGTQKNTLLLCPYNVEQFDDQEIEKEEVHEMYSVVGLFRSL